MPERARARAHARRHTDTRRVRLASDADSERFCVQGVAAAGIFTALIININAQSGIHPLPDLLDCGICMTLSLLPLQELEDQPCQDLTNQCDLHCGEMLNCGLTSTNKDRTSHR